MLGIPVVNSDGQPVDQGTALIPMSGLAIEDTWFVAGMKGTASNTLIANEVLLQRIGGVITIVMGLVFVGFIPALQREARFTPRQVSTLGGAPLLGVVFAEHLRSLVDLSSIRP